MAEKMTAADYRELERLCRKARYQDEGVVSDASKDILMGVEIWASRRAG